MPKTGFHQIQQKLLICILAAAFLLPGFTSCKKSVSTKPGWNTTLLTPLLTSTLGLNNLVTDSSMLKINDPDSSMLLVYRTNLYGFSPTGQNLKIPDTTLKASYSVTGLQLDDQKIVYPITLADLCAQNPQMALICALNGSSVAIPIISVPPSAPTDIDATQFFKTATFDSGFMDVKIKNGFPIEIDTIIFELKNKFSGTVISTNYFYHILPQASDSQTVNLSGKTIEGTLQATIIKMHSPGSNNIPVLINTQDAVVATLSVHDLKIKSATAIFPSQDLISQDQQTTYPISGGAKLKKMRIKSGTMSVIIRSSVSDTTKFDYSLPGAVDPFGHSLTANVVIPPAPQNGTNSVTKNYDLAGYTLDLTGDGSMYNTYISHLKARIDSTGIERSLSTDDSVYIDYALKDIVPDYVSGYLGQQIVTIGPSEQNFDLFNRIKSGSLSLEDVKVDMDIENGVGVDGRIILYDLSSVNSQKNKTVSLTSNVLVNKPLFINHATDKPLMPSDNNFHLDKSNSNIKALVENLPDKLKYKLDVFINPNGNTSNYGDFAYTDSKLNVSLNLTVPLSVITNQLAFQDTLDFNLGATNTNGSSAIKNGVFNLIAENGFPLNANIQLYLYDQYGNFLDSLMAAPHLINAGILNNNCKVQEKTKSVIQIPVDDNKMNRIRTATKAVVRAEFTTTSSNTCNGYQKIYSDYIMDVKLTGKFTYYTGE